MHEEHRSRMRERFLKQGLDSFEPHEVIEMILYNTISQGNTNETAHLLMDKFGSLSGVFDAPYEELLTVPGVGKVSAAYIKMMPQFCRRYYEDRRGDKIRIFRVKEAVDILIQKFIGRSNEAVILMLLDSQSRMLYCDVVNEGSIKEAPIYVRKIVSLALSYNAESAILSHNHPSGNVIPSDGDISATITVHRALEAVDVLLGDHIVISGEDYISMSHANIPKGLFEPF